MMRKENGLPASKTLGLSAEEFTVIESKKAYEKPTLTIVKFMFESDITRGSFETGQGGDNIFDGDGWWED
ncbi:MAG: hypothetical protein E7614_03385 [Ruminococcaceae bacterium]|nr:hypothetical protein [Oscillospiraceae bacterium]